jgi:hypothetical protein
MQQVQAVGMVIYTYHGLEERFERLWDWILQVETWTRTTCAEFHFSSRAKQSRRIWKATPENRQNLQARLYEEQPWSILDFGWPAGVLRSTPAEMKGWEVAFGSRLQPTPGTTGYRRPSYIYLEVHPDILTNSTTGVEGLLNLGVNLWQLVDGVYGFIDVETGVPLQDDISRNVIQLFDSTVPTHYHQEYRLWQRLDNQIDKRVWKSFWGNFLSSEHLRQLGGIKEIRSANRNQSRAESLDQAYKQGTARLQGIDCLERQIALANDGVCVTLSHSPLDWFQPAVQECQHQLQHTLGQVAIGEWDFN